MTSRMNQNNQKIHLFFLNDNDFENNPIVFIEFGTKIKNKLKSFGRIEIILFKDIVPKTVNNFISLIKGDKGYHYKGCKVHRIVPNFVIQTGDFTRSEKHFKDV